MVKPAQIPMVQMLMYDSGYPREPMVKHLGLCKGLYSIPDSDRIMEDLILTNNMSILAIDKRFNNPIGVAINGEFSLKAVQEENLDLDQKIGDLTYPDYGPVFAMRSHVDYLGKSIFQEYECDTIFMTKFLMVKPEMSMQGLATGLLSRAVQQASALGYKGIMTVVSHNGFKKAAMDNGMKVVGEIKFDEFIYKGEKVFAGIQDHSSCAFMAMKLE